MACGKIESTVTEIILAFMLHKLKNICYAVALIDNHCERLAFAILEVNISMFTLFLLSGTDSETSCLSTA